MLRRSATGAMLESGGRRGGGDEKLQKALSACGCGSRRAMEQLIIQGRVTVNRKKATIGTRVCAADRLAVDGKLLRRAAVSRLLSYHKPPGKIVERGATDSVFEDLPPCGGGRWINIGRLDVNSEGLLLFCTDGKVVQQLAHPSFAAEREYLTRVDGVLSDCQIRHIRRGINIDGKLLHPTIFAPHASSGGRNQWYRTVLTEGRNRAVRRLFAHFELNVSRLIRVRMGDYQLPRDLSPGDWRDLSPPECD